MLVVNKKDLVKNCIIYVLDPNGSKLHPAPDVQKLLPKRTLPQNGDLLVILNEKGDSMIISPD